MKVFTDVLGNTTAQSLLVNITHLTVDELTQLYNSSLNGSMGSNIAII